MGRPLKGSNILGCSGAISSHLHFRVFSGINRFQGNETVLETGFQSKSTQKIQNPSFKPVSDSWKLVLKLVYTVNVLENVPSATWRRNMPGCSDPWEGEPVKPLYKFVSPERITDNWEKNQLSGSWNFSSREMPLKTWWDTPRWESNSKKRKTSSQF